MPGKSTKPADGPAAETPEPAQPDAREERIADLEHQLAEANVEKARLAGQVAGLTAELDATRAVALEHMEASERAADALDAARGPEDEMQPPCVCYSMTLGHTHWKDKGAIEEHLCETDADLEKLMADSAKIGRTWHTSPKHCRPWSGLSAQEPA